MLSLVCLPAISEPAYGEKEKPEPLARNVRIDFKTIPLADDDKGVFIITGSNQYETRTEFKGDGTRVRFGSFGTLRIQDTGRLFLTYHTHLQLEGPEGKASFYVEGGILLIPGKETELARMGDKILVVTASYPRLSN